MTAANLSLTLTSMEAKLGSTGVCRGRQMSDDVGSMGSVDGGIEVGFSITIRISPPRACCVVGDVMETSWSTDLVKAGGDIDREVTHG